jgi:hypothetical protein
MPVNHKKKVIFVHIPKCAGTSIEKIFGMATRADLFTILPPSIKTITDESLFANTAQFERCASKNMQHYTIKEITAVLGQSVVAEYDVFSVVRNPYTRIVSEYNYCKAGKSRAGSAFLCETFADFVNTQLQLPESRRIRRYDGHLETQASYLLNAADDLSSIDTIYRFEDLDAAIAELTDKYNLPTLATPARSGAYTKNYAEYYTPELQETVKTFYAQDFELFNYDPNTIP